MKLLPLLPTLFVAGCIAVGPNFHSPAIDLDPRFVGGDRSPVGEVAAEPWWQDFRDPLLTELVVRGMQQNLDEAAAVERIREAEANLRATGFNAATDGSFDASHERSGGENIPTTTTKTASLSASLVLDLFGGLRRARESALASVVAAEAGVQTARLAWLADLIAAYSNARFYQAAIALTQDSISAREETVAITRKQLDAGAATEYGLAQAEALLSTARADLPQYAALFNANVFAIATLLDEPAAPILARMQRGAPQLRLPRGAGSGVPAELLHNRPDVRSAEADLAAAVAEIGVAEADLYPSIKLTGTVTVTAGVSSWATGPSLSLPVFNRGALAATRNAKISAAKQAEITWRSTVRAAVEDVQVALSNLRQFQTRAASLEAAARSYERAFDLAQENYRSGAITLLDLLDTDRSTASARISAASARNDAAQAWATLQIAVGSGAGVFATRQQPPTTAW